jgi:hypothetical protein
VKVKAKLRLAAHAKRPVEFFSHRFQNIGKGQGGNRPMFVTETKGAAV